MTEVGDVHLLRNEVEHRLELRGLPVLVNSFLRFEQAHMLLAFLRQFLDLLQRFFELRRLKYLSLRVLLNLDGLLLELRAKLVYYLRVVFQREVVFRLVVFANVFLQLFYNVLSVLDQLLVDDEQSLQAL